MAKPDKTERFKVTEREAGTPPRVLWPSSAEIRFITVGHRSVCGRSGVPFSREKAATVGGCFP